MAAKTSPEVIQATLPFADDIFGPAARAVISDAPTEEIIITPELLQESLDNYEAEIETARVMDAEIAPDAETTVTVEAESTDTEKTDLTADINAGIDTLRDTEEVEAQAESENVETVDPVDVDAEEDVTLADNTAIELSLIHI